MKSSTLWGLFIGIAGVYFLGAAFIDVMDVDAAQYASISREMLRDGQYLQIQHRGADYLDKPPLLFWLSSFFFQLFGVSTLVYRLPTLLFSLLGGYATYRLGKALYNEQTGRLAALILLSCQAFFLINHDVRTDTILANAVVFAIWQLWAFLQQQRWYFLLGASLGVALAMMQKGPIGLMVPILAIGPHLLLKGRWRDLFRWEWLLGLLLVLLLLSPMVYGLYQQFGAEGPTFFFWTQSFGRITGDSSWSNDTGYFYFVHTLLWSFLPWSLLGLFALGRRIWQGRSAAEWLCLSGVILPFIALSFSNYKLPHYIFVVYPLLAILTAQQSIELLQNARFQRALRLHHLLVLFLIVLAIGFVVGWVFPLLGRDWLGLALLAALLMLGLYWLLWEKQPIMRHFFPLVVWMIALNAFLNLHFYPPLLQYQSGSTAARWALEQNIPEEQAYLYRVGSHALDFYSGYNWRNLPEAWSSGLPQQEGPIWVYTDEPGRQHFMQSKGLQVLRARPFPHYHVTALKLPFLLQEKRSTVLKKRYLLLLDAKTAPE